MLEATVHIIRVVVREINKYIGENRGYGVLFVVIYGQAKLFLLSHY